MNRCNIDSCPKQINLHCHTICSDGSMTPIALIKQAQELGIEHLAITDHHSIESHKIILDNYNLENSRTKLWSGIEVSCLINKCLVHILGIGFNLRSSSLKPYVHGEAPTGEYLQGKTVVKSIHDAGGLAILAHPARYRISFKKIIDASVDINIDGAEAWYDYDMKPQFSATPIICEKIDNQLKQLGLISTCGTDTHGYSLLGR
ncbi:PHP domain-containing protein [Prochlorococcus sp. MIT 1300]|uniref:PHP domain-containing protein n=1 Tax=Prochlorococcus sp. MIT 1300 TaxID=3096218 RepID=UPI002A75CE39|nr:PHP domain-containing protein [Prochlorococcus sp. MIT 1300]